MEALANGRAGKKLDKKTLGSLREIARLRSQLLQKLGKRAAERLGRERKVEDCLKLPGTIKGRGHLTRALRETPFPRYEAVSDQPGLLIRTEANGTRQCGRFIGRKFKIVSRA